MKQLKNISKLCTILFIITGTISCSSVEIKDNEFCGDMGAAGASCFTTLSGTVRDIAKDEWDAERFGMICESAEVFADWKKVILKLCHKSRSCRYQAYEKLENFFNQIAIVNTNIVTNQTLR